VSLDSLRVSVLSIFVRWSEPGWIQTRRCIESVGNSGFRDVSPTETRWDVEQRAGIPKYKNQ
jgi:hypothetical protein